MHGVSRPFLMKKRKASRRLFTEILGAFRASLDLRPQRRLIAPARCPAVLWQDKRLARPGRDCPFPGGRPSGKVAPTE
jgi:hypothetical protein